MRRVLNLASCVTCRLRRSFLKTNSAGLGCTERCFVNQFEVTNCEPSGRRYTRNDFAARTLSGVTACARSTGRSSSLTAYSATLNDCGSATSLARQFTGTALRTGLYFGAACDSRQMQSVGRYRSLALPSSITGEATRTSGSGVCTATVRGGIDS